MLSGWRNEPRDRIGRIVRGALLVVTGSAGVAAAVVSSSFWPAAIPSLALASLGLWVLGRRGRTFDRASAERRVRLGWPRWAIPLVILAHWAASASVWPQQEFLPAAVANITVPVTLGISTVLVGGLAFVALRHLESCAAETRGALRARIGALATLGLAASEVGLGVVIRAVRGTGDRSELDLAFALPDRSPLVTWSESIVALARGQGMTPVLFGFTAVAVVSWLAQFASLGASFFLVPRRVRAVFWGIVDVLAFGAFVFALWTLPFVPDEGAEDVTLPAVALGITAVFATRALFRVIPLVLDGLERSRFEVRVAARMLRAKKSGFLTAIGLLSILAVSFSSCTLATTLSVMGGFRADLQEKILGNHAHVVVDRTHGTFDGWRETLEAVRRAQGVTGATPYVSGEVMLTSAIESPSGAELRGIDPETLGEATDLPRNMRFGALEYLAHPERLLDLPPSAMSGSLLGPSRAVRPGSTMEEPTTSPARADAGIEIERIDIEAGNEPSRPSSPSQPTERGGFASGAGTILDEIERLLDGIEDRDALAPAPTSRGRRDVLPGLVIGQELARTLRLHVGDEVTVVSPNGDLGPTGPLPRTRSFRVAGIFYTGMFEYDMQMAYTDLRTAQSFLRTGDRITGIEARVGDWSRAEAVAVEVRRAVGRDDLRVRSWREVNRNLFGALELEKLAMFITLGIAILVASFCIFAALVLMVQEKGREVAILKAMGAEDRSIVAVFLLQGVLIGVFGALFGLGLGYLVCFAAEHFKFIRMNPEVYYIDRLPVNVDPREFALVGIAAVVVCVLATVYPAILGSRLRPVDALRRT